MADSDSVVDLLIEDMQKSARAFFPEAIRLGAGFVYRHIKDGVEQVNVRVNEQNHRAYLEDRLAWNSRHLHESLGADMKRAIIKALVGEFPHDEAAREAVVEALQVFSGRVKQYAGAYWTVEERAVKEFGKEFDLVVNFIGPEDEANCPDCAEAVNRGPYPIDEAPVPGEDTVCRGNCRHALQIVGQAPVGV